MSSRYRTQNSWLVDFLAFRRMVTPILIQIFFWTALIGSFAAGVLEIQRFEEGSPLGDSSLLNPTPSSRVEIALTCFVLIPIALRIVCESLMLFFRLNETLTDIRSNTQQKG